MAVLISGCAKPSEIDFCRQTFSFLIKGNWLVEQRIDWSNFQAMGTEVGKEYLSATNDKDRKAYKLAFLKGVSMSFQRLRGHLADFVNWRVLVRGPEKLIVCADQGKLKKTIYLTFSGTKQLKLVAMGWEKP